MYDLIDVEMKAFQMAQHRVEEAIDQEVAYLQKQVNAGKIPSGVLYHRNQFLKVITDYLNATEAFHQAIGAMHQLYQPEIDQLGYYKQQYQSLEAENIKLRAWLRSHGRNPDELLPYIQLRECR